MESFDKKVSVIDNEYVENYDKYGSGHDLVLLIISHYLCVSYPIKSGCRVETIIFKP